MSLPPFPLDAAERRAFVVAALAEDVGSGDVTCESAIPADAALRAEMRARQAMTVSGMTLAQDFFRALDPDCAFSDCVQDGDRLQKDAVLMRISGKARALLTAERAALNTLQHLSGIATITQCFVDRISHTKARLLDTRKTIPGYRKLAKYATACGGAKNHRMGLYDAVMIKDNHIAVAGSVDKAVKAAQAAGQTDIQVECDTLAQLREAMTLGATSILLDNMRLEELREAVRIAGGKLPLEASGGVTLETIKTIAETGVDYISVGGALTLSAPAVDIGLDYAVSNAGA